MECRILVVLVLLNVVSLSSQQSQGEINADSVYVQFDKNTGELLELSMWWDNSTSIFKDVTAEEANNYCGNNNTDDACGLVDLTDRFGSGDVMLDGEPEFYNGDVRLKVYVDYTGKNVEDSKSILMPKDTLAEIIRMGEASYNSRLSVGRDDYNVTLMFVDEKRVPPPADNTTNLIMIIVSILILLAAVLLAIVLKCREKMEEKKMLEGVAGRTTVANDGENLTLTPVKTKGDEDRGGEGDLSPADVKIPHSSVC